jgi:hypothetical protein
MNFQVDMVTLGSIVAMVIAVSGWLFSIRKVNMAEGKHLAEMEQLAKEVAQVKGELKTIQACYQTTDGAIIEIRTDLAWIKAAVTDIKERLGRA